MAIPNTLRIAHQSHVGKRDLKAIPEGKSEDKISEEIEDSHEEVELSLDIDKMWDVLHFMLTGGRMQNCRFVSEYLG